MNPTNYKDLPKIAIIGRPNVGKSSLFNRMLRRRKAITEQTAGVTRDRLYAQIKLDNVDFTLIDTGGIISKPKERIAQLVYKQSREAIEESNAVILVCDVSSGLNYQDEHIASLLKRSSKKTFLVVNKVDSDKLKNDAFDFYKLGLGKPYGLSALHGKYLSKLYEDIIEYILDYEKQSRKVSKAGSFTKGEKGAGLSAAEVKMAVVGRPNVGKSSFINCILNQERLLVDEAPGTTRDSVDVSVKRDKGIIVIVDTAGMRHKKKIKETVEIFSLARTKQSIRRCDVALVMIDATQGLCRDDIAVVDYVIKEGKACVLLVNKRDLITDLNVDAYTKALHARFRPLRWIPIIFTSCKEKKNIIKAIDSACETAKRSRLCISTPKINGLLKKLQDIRPHPLYGKTRPRIYYATQIKTQPLKFLFFCANPKQIKIEYLRFIENNFRREFELDGVPIFFQLRARE